MIQKEELEQILNFVASRWTEATKDPNNKAMETLPNDFWMNSIGGKTAKKGFWVTTLMYTENEADAALTIDPYHGMTPLHMLTMNPHAQAETIAALLDVNVEVAFGMDNRGKMSLDYAREYNVGGLVGMINGLCNHRHAA